eukprot:CAMPEP_0194394286 /NCGR_PEP_ID=MMETSP0174-20130528/123771_1 /TAXON_ID=216777 /ORGANISM="Proboscia alata, Strain PI-D3" /LENGTH=887 /DNA_ID=CAMNT_0039190069 /DNA_START=2247 /DNA_END=4910 /DNA_ORIENTATION=-
MFCGLLIVVAFVHMSGNDLSKSRTLRSPGSKQHDGGDEVSGEGFDPEKENFDTVAVDCSKEEQHNDYDPNDTSRLDEILDRVAQSAQVAFDEVQYNVELSDSSENILPPGCDYAKENIDTSKTVAVDCSKEEQHNDYDPNDTSRLDEILDRVAQSAQVAFDEVQYNVEVSDSSENILPPGCDYAKENIDTSKKYDVCVVGAGLSGTVFAERTSELGGSVLVMDVRPHIGGNCFDYIDQKTGVLRNQYGSHLFHTKIEAVWNYVNNPRSPPWKQWYHQKYGIVNGTYVPIPVNILTVNRLFGKNIQNEEEMMEWLESVQIPCPKCGCRNGEEMAKSRVGQELYEAIFETYTIKQWGRSPREMDASVTARIPVRSNFDPRYFADKFQALPGEGYTAWFEGLLRHDLIDVVINTDFHDHQEHLEQACGSIVYTGPIDRYFEAKGYEKLQYRSITFREERHYNMSGFVLPSPVVNYPGTEVPYTRAIEYKHYLHRPSPHSVVVKETTSDEGEPYYPIPNEKNKALYQTYKDLATDLEKNGKVTFVGRLANYKYFDMDKALENALQLFYQKNWYKFYMGEQLLKYKRHIDGKIQALQEANTHTKRCDHPIYTGEFGMELRVNVPWAYHKTLHSNCRVQTLGVKGSQYMYFFSDEHTIVENTQREYAPLPDGNPFRSDVVHMEDFPHDTPWTAPPFSDFFRRRDIYDFLQVKPLVFISNKYVVQWKHKHPDNFLDVEQLRELLTYLEPNYTIVYKRSTAKSLEDVDGAELIMEEKDMIRTEFPTVVLYDDLQQGITNVEDENLLLFGIMSLADKFLSVQGGTAVASSFFGGSSTIFIADGKELQFGDYKYFHRFSDADVAWTHMDTEHKWYQKVHKKHETTKVKFMELVKKRL